MWSGVYVLGLDLAIINRELHPWAKQADWGQVVVGHNILCPMSMSNFTTQKATTHRETKLSSASAMIL